MHDHGSDDEIIRIFSARKTNRRERAAYPAMLALDVQGNEHQPLADLLGPVAGKDERATLPLHLGDEGLAVLLEVPRLALTRRAGAEGSLACPVC